MRKTIDHIEIKEPPIEELGKKHSCIRKTCATSCGCLVLLIIASIIILKITLGPKTRELKDLPPTFAQQIPLYDVEGIEKIEITEGQDRNKGAEYIAFVPKLFVSPVILLLDRGNEFVQSHDYIPMTAQEKTQDVWERFKAFMKTPVADHRDIYKVEWLMLEADANFIEEYYRNGLERAGFGIGVTSKTQTIRQFIFTKPGIDGVLYIRDEATTPRTDIIQLNVTIDGAALNSQ